MVLAGGHPDLRIGDGITLVPDGGAGGDGGWTCEQITSRRDALQSGRATTWVLETCLHSTISPPCRERSGALPPKRLQRSPLLVGTLEMPEVPPTATPIGRGAGGGGRRAMVFPIDRDATVAVQHRPVLLVAHPSPESSPSMNQPFTVVRRGLGEDEVEVSGDQVPHGIKVLAQAPSPQNSLTTLPVGGVIP